MSNSNPIGITQKQLWLGLVGLISLSGITCLLLGSQSFAATLKQMAPRIAQQSANSDAAEQVYQEALQLYQQGTAESLRQAISKFEKAVILYRQAGEKGSEALSILALGKVYDLLGEKQKALEFYNQALLLTQVVGNRRGEATTLSNLALLQRSQGNLKQALTLMDSAITIIEDLRTKIGSQELRASYFATVQNYYKFYIDLLMQLHQQNPSQGYDALALHASERACARSLIELLTEANANIRQGVDPKLLEQERTLTQQLNALERRRYELSSSQYTQQQLNEIKQQSESLLTQLDQLKAEIRVTSTRYAALKYPEPLTLQQIQQKEL